MSNKLFDFCKGVTSSSLFWKVTAHVNGQDEVLVDRPISGNVRPGLVYTLFYTLAFGTQSEGVQFNYIESEISSDASKISVFLAYFSGNISNNRCIVRNTRSLYHFRFGCEFVAHGSRDTQ